MQRALRQSLLAAGLVVAAMLLATRGTEAQVPPGWTTVLSHQKITESSGGFTGILDPKGQFGVAVAALGDLDGDGVPDLAVGNRHDDDGGPSRGAVWVLFLNPNGTVKSHSKISDEHGGLVARLADGDGFGTALGSLGDLDGDGVMDLAVCSSTADDGGPYVGAVWILFLSRNGTVKSHQKISATSGGFMGPVEDFAPFARSVTGIGDLDGDGTRDMVVGSGHVAWPDTGSGSDGHEYGNETAAWVLFLNSDGTVKSHRAILAGSGGFLAPLTGTEDFGATLASPGDIDDDGTPDLAIGAPRAWQGGSVWVVFLKPDGTVKAFQEIDATAVGFPAGSSGVAQFGGAVGACGDLDGDGVVDLIVGAPGDLADLGGINSGSAWVLFLNGDGAVKSYQQLNKQAGFDGSLDKAERFGSAVVGVGDLDGNDEGDLVATALYDDYVTSRVGAVWILLTTSGFESATWINLGDGLSGFPLYGIPKLAGTGVLVGGLPVTLKLSKAKPVSTTTLVIGSTEFSASFMGGVMVPYPDVLVTGQTSAQFGKHTITATWPEGIPSGTTFYFQHWIVDPAGPQGFSASNAISATTPFATMPVD